MAVEILDPSTLYKPLNKDLKREIVFLDTTVLWSFVWGKFQPNEQKEIVFKKYLTIRDLRFSQLLLIEYFLIQKKPPTLFTTSANIIEAKRHNSYFYENLLQSLALSKKLLLYILDISYKDLPQQLKIFYKDTSKRIGYGELIAYLSAWWLGVTKSYINYISDDIKANSILKKKFYNKDDFFGRPPNIYTSWEYLSQKPYLSPQETLNRIKIVL